MRREQWRALKMAVMAFFRFALTRLSLLFALMLFQRVTAGVGLLLIIPLLQLVGFDTGSGMTGEFAGMIGRWFAALA